MEVVVTNVMYAVFMVPHMSRVQLLTWHYFLVGKSKDGFVQLLCRGLSDSWELVTKEY